VTCAHGDDAPVLHAVDLELAAGELVLLIGPNGAGKSTLLAALSGRHVPAAGTVELLGEDARHLRPRERARRVACVPQLLAAIPEMRVRDFVLGGRYAHLSSAGRACAEDHAATELALREADLLELAERGLDEISGGQLARVLVARALAQDAPVVLLDEPAASLDPEHQVRLLELARSLVDAGRAALLATHELALSPRFADRVLLLAEGRVRALGTPSEVLRPEVLEPVYGPHLAFLDRPGPGDAPLVVPSPRGGRATPSPRG